MDPRIEKAIKKAWPRTKIELERMGKTSQKLAREGEVHFKKFSEQSVRELKKLSLNISKERLYFNLGKSVANTERDQWLTNKKITRTLKEIRQVERAIRSVGQKRRSKAK